MMNLVYYQPWSLMDRWHREIDELFTGRSDPSQPAVANGAILDPIGGLNRRKATASSYVRMYRASPPRTSKSPPKKAR